MSAVPIDPASYLLVRAASRLCALPLAHVGETMRPLPISPLPGAPRGVSGAAVIRGAPTPVVDLRTLLGDATDSPVSRFVTLRLDDRTAALAVDAVEGLYRMAPPLPQSLPPLLQNADTRLIEAVGALDERLLLVLRGSRIVPESLR